MSACPFDLDDVDVDSIEPYKGELQDLPQEVKDCEKSIREDNPDMDKSTAIAVCRDQLNMADGNWHLHVKDGEEGYKNSETGEFVTVEEATTDIMGDVQMSGVFQLAGVDTEPIERVEEGDNTVRYASIKLISPGVWTDSASRETIWYSPKGMKNLEVRPDNSVNLMHDDDNSVSEVGSIDPNSIEATDEGVFGDLVIDTSNAAGEYADENMQTTLESGGAKGFGGPSVEIDAEGQEVEFNDDKGMRELIGGIISGLGLVKNPAAKSVSFARQTAKRGVALSDGEQTKVFRQGTRNMADPELKAQVLSQVGEDFTLQGAMDQIQDDAQAIADELDVGIDEVMEVLDPLLDIEDDEEEDGDVENQEDEEEEDEETEEEEEEEDDDMDMQDRVSAIEERLTNVEDMVESAMQAEDFEEELSEELEDAKEELADAETVQELEEAKEDLEKRLSELEEEPGDRKTLADRDIDDDESLEGESTVVSYRDRATGAIRR